jgi:hypothetical protein
MSYARLTRLSQVQNLSQSADFNTYFRDDLTKKQMTILAEKKKEAYELNKGLPDDSLEKYVVTQYKYVTKVRKQQRV